MEYLYIFLSVLISQISIYFYLNNIYKPSTSGNSISMAANSENNEMSSFNQDATNEETSIAHKETDGILITELTTNDIPSINDNNLILKRNLKHLEFIDFLENRVSEDLCEKLSVDFLQELNSVKQEVQLKILETSMKLT